ncbi:MAG: hypothetical protein M0015_03060 [Betaproteobacteria bacterium]|nr:hypothetical protein [Betaproteobacteria bacterium]
MSRTYRRRSERHEYRWVLRDLVFASDRLGEIRIDRNSSQGRRAIARFHSDAEFTMRCAAPRWYRRVFDHRLRTLNDRELRRWLCDPGYDPVQQVRHRHRANWSWW